jgi:hypothetical protein
MSDVVTIRNHVDRYEYDEAREVASRLLGQIATEVS